MSAPATGGSLDQVARLLTLVPLLHSRERVRLDDAAELLGVPPAQVRRDLSVLFMCGLPGGYPDDLIDVDVEALDADGVIRVSNADYLARPLRLTPSEASALIVALRVLRDGADEETAAVVDRTLGKLEIAAAGAADRVAITDPAAADPVDPGVRRAVDRALAERRRLRIGYHVPARDEESDRVVDPHGLVASGGSTYLHAWCHRAEATRFFRLDRIGAATVLDEAVEGRAPDAPDLSHGFFAAGQAPTVTLRLAPEAAWVPEYYDVEVLDRADDGSQQVVLPVGDPRWLLRLLLRLAPSASVVGRGEFGDSFTAEAADALRLYE